MGVLGHHVGMAEVAAVLVIAVVMFAKTAAIRAFRIARFYHRLGSAAWPFVFAADTARGHQAAGAEETGKCASGDHV